MEVKPTSVADLNDILFEHKNKEYGAYALRRKYQNNLLIAAAIGIALLLFIFVGKTTVEKFFPPAAEGIDTVSSVRLTALPDPPSSEPEKLPPPMEAIKPPEIKQFVAEMNLTNRDITPPPTNEELAKAPTGSTTIAGKKFTLNAAVVNRTINTPDTKPKENKQKKVFEVFDEEPKFKGGDEATFIHDHLTYPQAALDNSIEGTVVLSVVIDVNGKMSELAVLSKVPMGCTEEAKRVVSLMNGKWEPGKVNGNPVTGRKTFSIKFTIPH